MKNSILLLFLCISVSLYAQQKHSANVLVDTTNYRIEQIDSSRFNGYLNSTSHHTGVDTLPGGKIIKCYSPYTNDMFYIEKQDRGGSLLSVHHSDGTFGAEEKLSYYLSFPFAGYDVEFIHWLLAKSAIAKAISLKDRHLYYLLITFKNMP